MARRIHWDRKNSKHESKIWNIFFPAFVAFLLFATATIGTATQAIAETPSDEKSEKQNSACNEILTANGNAEWSISAFQNYWRSRLKTGTLKIAQEENVPSLQSLINTVRSEFIPQGVQLEGVFDVDLAELNKNFGDDRSALFIVVQDQDVIASGGFATTGTDEVELRKIYFDNSLRGSGMGKDWVRTLVQTAKNLGAKRIWLVNHRNLSTATAIYRAVGFTDFIPSAEVLGNLNPDEYWFLEISDLQNWGAQ